MIRKVKREGEFYIRLTKDDYKRLKEGESFVPTPSGKVLVRDNLGETRLYDGGIPTPVRKNWIEFTGHDCSELMLHSANPNEYKSDWLLLRARRESRRAKAAHLHNAELRSIAWFAFIPEVRDIQTDLKKRYELREKMCDETNLLASKFYDVWLREPDAVVRLLVRLRSKRNDPETAQVEADFLSCAHKSPPIDDAVTKKRVGRARKLTRPANEIIQMATKLGDLTFRSKGQIPRQKRP